MPIGVRLRAAIKDAMAELNAMAADAGRGPIPVAIYGMMPREEVIDSYLEAGVDEGIFWMPTVGEDEAMRLLKDYTRVRDAVAKAGA
jgi:hypothetical protein